MDDEPLHSNIVAGVISAAVVGAALIIWSAVYSALPEAVANLLLIVLGFLAGAATVRWVRGRKAAAWTLVGLLAVAVIASSTAATSKADDKPASRSATGQGGGTATTTTRPTPLTISVARNWVGEQVDAVTAQLADANVAVGVQTVEDRNKKDGVVIEQQPAAGQPIPPGGVTLTAVRNPTAINLIECCTNSIESAVDSFCDDWLTNKALIVGQEYPEAYEPKTQEYCYGGTRGLAFSIPQSPRLTRLHFLVGVPSNTDRTAGSATLEIYRDGQKLKSAEFDVNHPFAEDIDIQGVKRVEFYITHKGVDIAIGQALAYE